MHCEHGTTKHGCHKYYTLGYMSNTPLLSCAGLYQSFQGPILVWVVV